MIEVGVRYEHSVDLAQGSVQGGIVQRQFNQGNALLAGGIPDRIHGSGGAQHRVDQKLKVFQLKNESGMPEKVNLH
jgi:hypothetical protein